MNAYVTIFLEGGSYHLAITVAHSAWNIVELSANEARELMQAGVPLTKK